MVKSLLDAGANIDANVSYSGNAILAAAREGHVLIDKLLRDVFPAFNNHIPSLNLIPIRTSLQNLLCGLPAVPTGERSGLLAQIK